MKTKYFYILSLAILLPALLKLPSDKPFFRGMWVWSAIKYKYRTASKDLNWDWVGTINWNTYMTQIILALLIIITIKLLFMRDK